MANQTTSVPNSRSIQAVLDGLIDYAGLFPPASLSLTDVVANYAIYRGSAARFALARLIVPASQLLEIRRLAEPLWNSDTPWQISLLLPSPETHAAEFEQGIQALDDFNQLNQARAVIDVIETKANLPATIAQYSQAVPDRVQVYWELPHVTVPIELLEQLLRADVNRHRAKIRTGGVKPELIPPLEQVAQFMLACAERRIPFKATAGLHHPWRQSFPLTYEPQAPCAVMHGFLNVFLAACRTWNETVSLEALMKMLQADSLHPICFRDEGVFGPDWQLTVAQITEARQTFATAFGSCSFTEPIHDLIDLQLLTDAFRV